MSAVDKSDRDSVSGADNQPRDDGLAIVPNKARELGESYVTRIRELHVRGLELDETIRSVVQEKIEITMQTGELIADAQKKFKHAFDELVGRWIGLSPLQLRSYTKIAHRERKAREFVSEWQSLKDLGPATGLLPPAKTGYSKPLTLHRRNFFAIAVNLIAKFRVEWKKELEHEPLSRWSRETLEQLDSHVRHLADIHAKIRQQIAKL